jgi:hypothetical protein
MKWILCVRCLSPMLQDRTDVILAAHHIPRLCLACEKTCSSCADGIDGKRAICTFS